MKTTLELPEDLVNEIESRAVHEGKQLQEAVADLLRKGLAAAAAEIEIPVCTEQSLLQRRKELAEKFISGEWGAELAGFEAGRAADRESARARAESWRS
jgi:hypothetical protein